jgi:hypothetical protein
MDSEAAITISGILPFVCVKFLPLNSKRRRSLERESDEVSILWAMSQLYRARYRCYNHEGLQTLAGKVPMAQHHVSREVCVSTDE